MFLSVLDYCCVGNQFTSKSEGLSSQAGLRIAINGIVLLPRGLRRGSVTPC